MASDFITVTYARLGQAPQDVALAPGTTVEQFKTQTGLEEVSVKRSGEALSPDQVLQDGWRLVITAKVEGGL